MSHIKMSFNVSTEVKIKTGLLGYENI